MVATGKVSTRATIVKALIWTASAALLVALVNCGGGSISGNFNPPRGTLSVSISDPPSCKVPNGNLLNVWITVRSVQAHISSSAPDADPGWQELAPNLANAPVQIDLLAVSQGCILAMLGSNVSLPVGDYQQIRLILLSNTPAQGEPVPANNACSGNGFNCLVLQDTTVHQLNLSSQANTGIKIPPGQIVGGPIRVSSGQHTDVNIDFNACASIVLQGNGQYRLRPTLTAGQVSSISSGLSGQVVDSLTQAPINGGSVFVAVEQPDSNGVDRIIMQTAADSNGNFNFCPLPTGTYDVVAVALNGNGVAYAASVAVGVPSGTNMGKLPLIAPVANTDPGTIQGLTTAVNGGMGASVDVAHSALQSITVNGNPRPVTVPLLGMSVANVTTSATPMGVSCPMGTNCAQYTLIVPASNPSFGTFTGGTVTLSTPVVGDVLYAVDARAFAAASTTPICSPSRILQDKDPMDLPLKITSAMTVTAKDIAFTGCM